MFTIIYNVYFHPLRKFPGPITRTGVHAGDYWHLFRGTHPQSVKELHDIYGDVVRIRPDSLTFRNAAAWKDIYGSRPGKGQLRKDPRFYTIGGEEDQTNIVYSNDADHSRMRKLLSHAFSDTALRQQEPIMAGYFELLIQKLKARIDGPTNGVVDLSQWYNFLTFDIVGDMCFGEPFDALENGEYHKWMAGLLLGAKHGRVLSIATFYQPLLMIINGLVKLFPKIGEAKKEHGDFTRLKTKKRLDAKTDRKDFMSYILRHNDDRGMTQEELMETSGMLIIAGSETTATLLSGLTYYLLKTPDKYAKVLAEVRGAFKTAEDITLTSTGHLPYLHACLEEGLRLYPPVPTALPRKTPKEGAVIGDVYVPGGTSVAVPQYASYHSEKNFFEPKTFVPERWLPNPPEAYKNDNFEIFQPFSTGPRGCIGKK